MAFVCVKMIHSLYDREGEGSPSNPLKFKDQDYKQLKEALLSQGQLFQDEKFPANLNSLGNKGINSKRLKMVEWLRPRDLHPDAAFILDGISRFDVKQGEIGNCWFLAAIGALTFHKSLMMKVVPLDQNFKDGYAGIFHFKFWRFGKWVDVVVDDLLPTIGKKPLSVTSRSGREFWPLLLEKAYAKVCGSYGDMICGNLSEGIKDLSGGVPVSYMLSSSPPELWDIIGRAIQCNAMLECDTFDEPKGREIEAKFGLVSSHAFTVTGVTQVESRGKKVNLVRIWNPWGEGEWNGDWSDNSAIWSTVSSEVQAKCREVKDDGEFWINMEDFCTYFMSMAIGCQSPHFLDGDMESQWSYSLKEGCWEAGKSAGGSDNQTDGFWTNPQYRLRLKERKGGINLLLSLLQKPDEEYRSKIKYHEIGFYIYRVPPEAPEGRLPSIFFQDASPVIVSGFVDIREYILYHSLETGEYLIIPCTYESNKTASFILTTYYKEPAEMM